MVTRTLGRRPDHRCSGLTDFPRLGFMYKNFGAAAHLWGGIPRSYVDGAMAAAGGFGYTRSLDDRPNIDRDPEARRRPLRFAAQQ